MMSLSSPSASRSTAPDQPPELPTAEKLAAIVRTFTLLGALAFVQLDAHLRGVTDPVTDVGAALLAVYVAATGVSHCLRRSLRHTLVPVAAVDVLLISLIVFWTGGVSSLYYPLYFLPIMQAAVRLRLRDALATSVLAGVCYAASMYLGAVHPRGEVSDLAKVATFACVGTFMAFFCGILMRETRAHRQEARRTLELYGVATALQQVGALPESLRQVVRCVARAMPASRVEIWEAQTGGGARLLASFPEDETAPEDVPGEVRQAIVAGGAMLQPGTDRRRQAADAEGGMAEPSWACVAAELGGSVLGAIRVVGIPDERPLNQADLTTLGVVAAQVAVALDAARLNDELAQQAKTDALTGLANRGEFWRRLENAFALPRSFPLSIAMLDVDSLKGVNDTRGHLAGDDALTALGALLRSHIGPETVAARYGGDEFVILLPQTHAREAQALMQSLLKAAERPGPEGSASIRFSVGIACAETPAHGAERIVAAADVALYQAKRRGGSRIALAPPTSRPDGPVPPGPSELSGPTDAPPEDPLPDAGPPIGSLPAPGPSYA
jgi:diguanylate cyclase (GGDEF)-like protein